MAFLIGCPNCGERGASEFRFGGESTARPEPDVANEQWADFYYLRRNVAGVQQEWCYHAFGCRRWFIAQRDTVSNEVGETRWPTSA
jgi:sarcosine oxidase subunit delta